MFQETSETLAPKSQTITPFWKPNVYLYYLFLNYYVNSKSFSNVLVTSHCFIESVLKFWLQCTALEVKHFPPFNFILQYCLSILSDLNTLPPTKSEISLFPPSLINMIFVQSIILTWNQHTGRRNSWRKREGLGSKPDDILIPF